MHNRGGCHHFLGRSTGNNVQRMMAVGDWTQLGEEAKAESQLQSAQCRPYRPKSGHIMWVWSVEDSIVHGLEGPTKNKRDRESHQWLRNRRGLKHMKGIDGTQSSLWQRIRIEPTWD